jgi:hypothetical protein
MLHMRNVQHTKGAGSRDRSFVPTPPDLVASMGAARYGFVGVLELHLRDGNRRRITLSAPPRRLNEALRGAGFPVS